MARKLDREHSRQADGTSYPCGRDQMREHLVGLVLAALQAGLGPARPPARPPAH